MYQADIGDLSSSLKIEIIDGVNHTDLIVKDRALESIIIWMDYLRGQPLTLDKKRNNKCVIE
jgi:hypothetical protein